MSSTKPFESQGTQLLRQLALQGKRVFDMESATIAASRVGIAEASLKKILSNLAKQERLLRLRRGLYVQIGRLPEETHVHPFLISNYLVHPSAISHWSALQHYGLTEQIPHAVTASSPNKVTFPSMRRKQEISMDKHAWEIFGIHYEYMTIQEKHFYGIEKIWIDEHSQIMISDKERTLLDVFVYPKLFGGIGESLGILQNALADLNIEKLIKYAIQYNKKSLAKRLGWALEYFGIAPDYLTPLQKIPINYFCRLDPQKAPFGACDKRWMIQNNLKGEKE